MTDAEIIKALECCKDNSFNNFSCEKCSYHGTRGCCVNNLCEDALALINRQDAEIERLKDMVSQNEGALPRYEALIRAEAVKEFAERLKEKAITYYTIIGRWVSVKDIDNLVKEMEGEHEVS